MALSNHERVGKALELLNKGLMPFVEREMKAVHGDRWQQEAQASLRDELLPTKKQTDLPHWDTQALLAVMWNRWNDVFRKKLGHAERSLVSELREVRKQWAHQESISTDDAYRALDSIHRLLTAVSAEEAEEVDRQKQEILRTRFAEQARQERRRISGTAIEGQPPPGYKPWREVVTPHPDIATGRYQQAEFAADLAQVHRGEGADEYRNPRNFFRRTFMTEGLQSLLVDALKRTKGNGGNPVIELQTSFGGGKTHSMLALYHLFSGTSTRELAGVEPVMQRANVSEVPEAKRAVLVGTALSPARARVKPDGTQVKTLWGEMAWQLLGKKGFEIVAAADAAGVSPGEDLVRLFRAAEPCIILIDEWIAFVRQLYGVSGLPAGSFGANMTFAQALTESAKAASKTMVVASIPSSDIEIGGEGGQAALESWKHEFDRIESPWRPASSEESFEIVRRRLFEPITDPAMFAARDAVARAFSEHYRNHAQEFPSQCREGEYERRIIAAYPIHPELFDRLYIDWSSLERFQRTRGILRLMAAVIQSLWQRNDAGLLILPASVPIDEPSVQQELTRYLEDNWVPVIERDVDGPSSLPLRLDREVPTLGRYSACRRVARTIYLGSAPTVRTAARGLEDQQIRLGCAQPGETVATFGDALRRLTDHAYHLYVDGRRYWYSTQPSVTRLAQDRAAQFQADDVAEEIRSRLRGEQNQRGDFVKVHPCPSSSADVPDEPEARLVILGPNHPHTAKDDESQARMEAEKMLDQRGTVPRSCRNAPVFLAPDRSRLSELDQAVRQYLAWKSIENERETLNLDAFQSNQAKTKREQAEETVKQRIPETYQWLLAPGQGDPRGEIEWQETRLIGIEALAVRASKKLKNEDLLVTVFAATSLRKELDRIPLWRGDHVSLKLVAENFAKYLYLPRLRDQHVLLEAVEEGLRLTTWELESFAYADGWDEASQRYRGLRGGKGGRATLEGGSLLVKPDVALKQIAAETAQTKPREYPPPQEEGDQGQVDNGGADTGEGKPGKRSVPRPKRFHGAVELDATRLGRDAGQIAEEVVQHLSGLMGSKVEVTLEIQAEIPAGVPENVVRTVTENCRTLRFKSHGFEDEAGSEVAFQQSAGSPALAPSQSVEKSAPKSDDFRRALRDIFVEADRSGKKSVDVNAGRLHRRVGGYPGPNHRMASCCEAMLAEKGPPDTTVSQPAKGKGASLTIRYAIPRK
jgi:predicted AAA+ superfamily ATPase